ncbi:MAG: hypothetical protein GF331_09335 [Chitinivibrionales bacterium]|nr:hypothetical protein [Chitinivibrionales bacterium]
MLVTRSHLRGTHYCWGTTEAGWAHSEWERQFERKKGEHMVAVIQKAANALHLTDSDELGILEDLITSELPSGNLSRHDAFLWVYVEYKKRRYRQGGSQRHLPA